MNFGKILMLCLSELIHAVYEFYVTIIALDEGLLVVHNVFIWRLFQPEYLNRPKIRVFNVLNKLKLLKIPIHLIIIQTHCCGDSLTHFLVFKLFIKQNK